MSGLRTSHDGSTGSSAGDVVHVVLSTASQRLLSNLAWGGAATAASA